jgi:hypothetical protein
MITAPIKIGLLTNNANVWLLSHPKKCGRQLGVISQWMEHPKHMQYDIHGNHDLGQGFL